MTTYSQAYPLGNLTVRQCTVCAAPILDQVFALRAHTSWHIERDEDA